MLRKQLDLLFGCVNVRGDDNRSPSPDDNCGVEYPFTSLVVANPDVIGDGHQEATTRLQYAPGLSEERGGIEGVAERSEEPIERLSEHR